MQDSESLLATRGSLLRVLRNNSFMPPCSLSVSHHSFAAMPGLGPISRQEVNHRRQVKDRLQLWDDKHSSIKTAHKVLQDKKEMLKFEQERKLEEARREVSQDPCSLARYDIIIAQAMKFGYTLGTLEAGCDCEYKKEEEIERLRHEEVERKYGFSVPLTPQNIVRSMDPSPSPDPPSPSPEGGGIEPERTVVSEWDQTLPSVLLTCLPSYLSPLEQQAVAQLASQARCTKASAVANRRTSRSRRARTRRRQWS